MVFGFRFGSNPNRFQNGIEPVSNRRYGSVLDPKPVLAVRSGFPNLNPPTCSLLHIGMEKIVPNKNLSRRHSTGNFTLDYTQPKVLSRYLRDPIGSCHDQCKPSWFKPPTEPKSTGSVSNRPDRDQTHVRHDPPNSVQKIKKLFTSIPKPSTKDSKTSNNSLLKYQVKPHDLKSKSNVKSKSTSKSTDVLDDPFEIPVDSRVRRRRYSEIIIPTTGLGDVLNTPPLGGLTRSVKKNDNKINESKRDSKPANPTKINAKTTPGNAKVNTKKVQTLKTQNSSTKPEVDQGSRKSKPAKPVQEKALHVLNEETAKTRTSASKKDKTPQIVSQKDGEKKDEARQNDSEKKDETQQKDNEKKGFSSSEVKTNTENPIRVEKLCTKDEDSSSQKLKFNRGKIINAESDNGGPGKLNFAQGNVLGDGEKSENEKISLRRLASDGEIRSSESHSINVVLKRHNSDAKKRNLGLNNNVIEETASKLIETRKSKVKALVGAFELISANDN